MRALCALLTLASTCRKTARGGPYFAATATFVSAIQPVTVAVAVSVSMLCCFICTGMSDCQGRKKYDAPGVTKDDNLEEHLLTRCHCPGPDSCQSKGKRGVVVSGCPLTPALATKNELGKWPIFRWAQIKHHNLSLCIAQWVVRRVIHRAPPHLHPTVEQPKTLT